MALPKLTTPTYELEVPSTDEKISYRPFLVKEEKILLMAMESGKNEDIVNAVEQIVSECTFNKLKVGNMPMFDVEYLFLNILFYLRYELKIYSLNLFFFFLM